MNNKILVGSNFLGFKNRIINGDFSVWQRGTNVGNTTTNYVGVDRFYHWSYGKDSNGNITGPVFKYADEKILDGNDNTLKYTVSNLKSGITAPSFGLSQRMEPLMFWDLINKNITISYWIKTNRTSITRYIVHYYYDSNNDLHAETLLSSPISITPNEWNRIKYTVKLESPNFTTPDKTYFCELFGIGIYDNAENGDYIQLKQVQVEKGDTATEFEQVPYDVQIQRCLRYYEYRNQTQALPQYADNSTSSETSIYAYIPFLVRKRTIPSVKLISWSEINTPNLSGKQGVDGFNIYASCSSANAARIYEWAADAEL